MNVAVVNVVKEFVVRAGTFAKANSPVILAGAAAIGVIGVAVSAVKATQKADDILQENEIDKEETSTAERLALTWKCYIPTAILTAGTLACIAGGTAIGVRRLAAATLAYEVANGKLTNAREEIEKFFGEPGEKMFDTAMAEKTKPVDIDGNYLIPESPNRFWVVDPFGRRWITDDITLKRSQNLLNEKLITDGRASVNDWYDINSQEPSEIGDYFSWDAGNRILDMNFREARMIDGLPHVYLDYECRSNDYFEYSNTL